MKPAIFEVVARVDLTHWWFRARRSILRNVLECVLPAGQGALVVDVGCGTGANIAALTDRYSCLGIDTAEDGIRLARDRFSGVQFICGVAPDDLGEAASRADAYLLMDVLEHVPDDVALLRRIVDVLRPGGYLLITVPGGPELWSTHDESLGHYRRYDLPGFRQIWEDMPVSEVMVSYFNTRLYMLVKAARAMGRMRRRREQRTAWDMRVPGGFTNWLLQRCFVGESKRLVDLARRRRRAGYSYGASLMALLRREPATGPDRSAC